MSKSFSVLSTWPEDSHFNTPLEDFAKALGAASNGSITLDLKYPNQTISALELDVPNTDAVYGRMGSWKSLSESGELFSDVPGGPYGMDQHDFVAWMDNGSGDSLHAEIYARSHVPVLLHVLPAKPFGWFKRPIKLDDVKGRKFAYTGRLGHIYEALGLKVLEIPVEGISEAVKSNAVDCAASFGLEEDVRLGFPNVFGFLYLPTVDALTSFNGLMVRRVAWDALPGNGQQLVRVCARGILSEWQGRSCKGQAESLYRVQESSGVRVLRTPPDQLIAFLRIWDDHARRKCQEDELYQKVSNSQRNYASLVVPSRRSCTLPYSFCANYYWPERAINASRQTPKAGPHTFVEYRVKLGETLSGIIRRQCGKGYRSMLPALRSLNPGLRNPDVLRAGDTLKLPK